MKLINWIRFTWDLGQLPELETALPEHYDITPARPEDEMELRKVISSSFTLDPTWNSSMHELMEVIEPWLEKAFASEKTVFLALRHGSRIIGAAVLASEPESENNLSPGPCVLMEYRNRGFGARLLERSLTTLRDAGLVRATALTKEHAPVTKFLYKKFGGTPSAVETSPLLAA